MSATFNMGVGMVLIVPVERVGGVLRRARARGTMAFEIGRTVVGAGVAFV
jgi:phosphoribosylaminoimidazole (AIR) synthetase